MRLTSTRDPAVDVTFLDAVVQTVPPDGGLFVPRALPHWDDVDALLALEWPASAVAILDRLLGDEFAPGVLASIVRAAFDFPLPLIRVDDDIAALELFHGPSLAFKDFGARFLAGVLAHGAPGPRTILTATSGDTGAAVAAAFWHVPDVRVVVLYPAGGVSPLQERQIACLGDNVHAVAVDGSFDACQRLARACFADAQLSAAHGLTSANSINIARLLAQVPYYFEAVAQWRRAHDGDAPVIAVPSGNFGNLCAGLYARALGLPVRAFVAATNANRTVPDYLDTARYEPRPSVATLSNAMDVGAPGNWERIRALYRDARGEDWPALRAALRWGAVSDDATLDALRALHTQGYLADPHGAVAWHVLRDLLQSGEGGVFLGTAHPAKFAEVFEARLGLTLDLPPALAALRDMPLHRVPLVAAKPALEALLRDTVPVR